MFSGTGEFIFRQWESLKRDSPELSTKAMLSKRAIA
jgi:hypothetical protein